MQQPQQQRSNFSADSVLSPAAAQLAPHEEEMERKRALLAKVKVLRDSILVNRGQVQGDETKEYMWVNVKLERRMWFETLGWALATDDCIKSQYKQADGTHLRGDLILYEIDKEMAEAFHLYDVVRGIEMSEGANSSFMTEASKANVPTFIPKI